MTKSEYQRKLNLICRMAGNMRGSYNDEESVVYDAMRIYEIVEFELKKECSSDDKKGQA